MMLATVTASNSHAILADELSRARAALSALVAAVKYEHETRWNPVVHAFAAVPTLDRALGQAREVLGS